MPYIEEITDKKIWNEFINKVNVNFFPFFQTWNWGEVQSKLGFPIKRLGVFNEGQLVGICLIVDIQAKRGHYLHLRHGPVFIEFNSIYFQYLITYLKQYAKINHISFLRVSPLLSKEHIYEKFFSDHHFINSPLHNMDAEVCWVLSLQQSEEDVLKSMRKTHRYLIKKAGEQKISIIKGRTKEDIEKFLPLYKKLSTRKHFVPHRGVMEEFLLFAEDQEEVLLLAQYDGKIIAGAIIAYVGNMAIYRHGASDDAFRHLSASYLLQWEAICEAKKKNKLIYNFWGITTSDSRKHPWYGLTLFKMGFGGEVCEYMHAKDLPLNINYWKTYAIDTVTKRLKGY